MSEKMFAQPFPEPFAEMSDEEFLQESLRVFRFQYNNNPVYRRFAGLLGAHPSSVNSLHTIPFLPVSMFKTHDIVCGTGNPVRIFFSSGTTGAERSRHCVTDLSVYRNSLLKGFTCHYGDPGQYHFLALTPGPCEASQSSLVFMIHELMKASGQEDQDFFLNHPGKLAAKILRYPTSGPPVPRPFVIGLTWALLDFAERFSGDYPDVIFLETGGMKGRRREITREELHGQLTTLLGVPVIHSEYGMTELLSQAWSKGNGIFRAPPWMKVLIRETGDPLSYVPAGRDGGINLIDLANLNSCSFLATQDLGRLLPDGSFEVLGRFDEAEVRGCSLLMS